MLSLRIENATRTLAKDQKEYHSLSIRDETIGGVRVMSSIWEPTPNELLDISTGGSIYIGFATSSGVPIVAVLEQPNVRGRATLLRGGTIKVSIPGSLFPPIFVCIVTGDRAKTMVQPVTPYAVVTYQEAPN